MGVPIAINGRELNVNDMAVEPGAEYLVTVGKTASSVKVERTDLKAENERLRRRYGECQNELTQTMCDYGAALDDIVKLKAENDKLRELVADMWICISHGEGWDCTGCRRDPDSVCLMGISEFSQRMRELGIEVDQ